MARGYARARDSVGVSADEGHSASFATPTAEPTRQARGPSPRTGRRRPAHTKDGRASLPGRLRHKWKRLVQIAHVHGDAGLQAGRGDGLGLKRRIGGRVGLGAVRLDERLERHDGLAVVHEVLEELLAKEAEEEEGDWNG